MQRRQSKIDATIIIPAVFWDPFTDRCVIESQKLFPDAEIIVVLDTLSGSAMSPKGIIIKALGPVTIAEKRNYAAGLSSRNYLAFIDSDAYPKKDWLPAGLDVLRAGTEYIKAVCGPNVSPPKETFGEYLVGRISLSNFIVINAHYLKQRNTSRIVKNAPSCNFIICKKVFLSLGGMNPELQGGEDMEFCKRYTEMGYKIAYDPDVLVFHKNRNVKQFFMQRLSYGGFTADKFGKQFDVHFFVSCLPALFIIYLFFTVILCSLLEPPSNQAKFIFIPLVSLIGIVLFEGVRLSERLLHAPAIAFLLLFSTVTPGLGTLGKLFNIIPSYKKIYSNYK